MNIRPTDTDAAPAARKTGYHSAARPNEQIGGGFFIFRRGSTTGRIKTGYIKHGKMPFEHPSLEAATAEAERLGALYGGIYDVFARAWSLDAGPVKERGGNKKEEAK